MSFGMASYLEGNLTLGADGNTVNVGSRKSAVNIGGPVVILPFNIEAIIGLEGRREGVIISEGSFPRDGDITIAVDRRRNSIVVIQFLGDGNFLVVRRSREFYVCVTHLVIKNDFLRVLGGRKLDV